MNGAFYSAPTLWIGKAQTIPSVQRNYKTILLMHQKYKVGSGRSWKNSWTLYDLSTLRLHQAQNLKNYMKKSGIQTISQNMSPLTLHIVHFPEFLCVLCKILYLKKRQCPHVAQIHDLSHDHSSSTTNLKTSWCINFNLLY